MQSEQHVHHIQVDGRRGAWRPKLTWKTLTENDCHEWKLKSVDPQERSTWRSGVCLFDLILYIPSTIFQLNRDGSPWVEPVLS